MLGLRPLLVSLAIILVGALLISLMQWTSDDTRERYEAKCSAQSELRTDTSLEWDCTCTTHGSTAACACDRRGQ